MASQVKEAVVEFHRKQMSVVPAGVSVDIHPHAVVVTLQGITCPAEQSYAQDSQGRESLTKLRAELYAAAKSTLESAVGNILGRPVRRSTFSVDPGSGDGFILLALSHRTRQGSGPEVSANTHSPLT